MKSSRSSKSRDKSFILQLAEMMDAGGRNSKTLHVVEPEPELMPYAEWEKQHHLALNRLPNLSDSKVKQRVHEQILHSGDQILQSYASAATSRTSRSRSRSNFSEIGDEENELGAVSPDQKAYEDLKLANAKLHEQYEQDLAEARRQFDKRLKQVVQAKDTMCEEKLNELRANLLKEHQRNMQKLEEEVTRNVIAKCRNEDKTNLRNQLLEEFEAQRAKQLQTAVANERAKFEKILKQRLSQQERSFEDRLAFTVAQLIEKHETQYNALVKLFTCLYEKHVDLLSRCEDLEADFRQLQTDYQRFMNYTEGMFHSDFMMKLRTHGLDLAKKKTDNYSKDYMLEMQSFYQRLSNPVR